MKTNAIRQLEISGVEFALHRYDVSDGRIDALAVAEKLGRQPERLFKTLVARTEEGNVGVYCIPGSCELDLKKAARAAGSRSVSLVPVKELKELTGYERGGCAPVGLKHPFPVWLEESAELFDRILVSAGRIGFQIELAPSALCGIAGAKTADLV